MGRHDQSSGGIEAAGAVRRGGRDLEAICCRCCRGGSGRDSPQALGCIRKLMVALAGQKVGCVGRGWDWWGRWEERRRMSDTKDGGNAWGGGGMAG